jgi:hypothetical protein
MVPDYPRGRALTWRMHGLIARMIVQKLDPRGALVASIRSAARRTFSQFYIHSKEVLNFFGVSGKPGILITSVAGTRIPVYLVLAVVSQFKVECNARDFWFFRRFVSTRELMFKVRVLRATSKPAATVVLSGPTDRFDAFGKRFILDGRYYARPPTDGEVCVMPYFAHPEFYRLRLHQVVRKKRRRRRDIRIVFSGTVNDETYARDFHFPILDRPTIMRHIMAEFSERITRRHSPGNTGDRKRPIHLFMTDESTDTVSKHALAPAQYLGILCNSAFSIAPPGIKMPHCHNIIEAMAAGSIPITNYGHYLSPPLVDGVTCLSFTTLRQLSGKLQKAIEMDDDTIAAMRDAVIIYYETNLAPEAFGRKLRAADCATNYIVVNEERLGNEPSATAFPAAPIGA